MAETWVYRDGQRLTPAMLVDFIGLDDEFFRRTGCRLKIRSGVRTDDEQERIWYDRMVLAHQVNGRRVYETRWWNGRLWYRISSAGTVAPPGSSNHQIGGGRKGALDIYDTGSDAGVLTRGSFRANVFDEIAGKYGYDSEGYAFGETWHKRYNRDPWRAVPSGGGGAVAQPQEDEMTVSVRVNKQHLYTMGEEFISHAGTIAQADIARNVNSARDERHELNATQFYDYMDAMGIPRSVVDLKTGAVLNPQSGKHEGNGVWSRRREAVALAERNAAALAKVAEQVATLTPKTKS